ncbi:MAG: response regulator [Thermoguttaceae bacterium]|nr:response regulator [Thermoguttaceae bacterium]MDW8037247.1 response regulator [Thermoguttaceae bacterium]
MSEPRKLLVVDDEEVICQACRRIFTRQGFEVETYLDPREALAKAKEQSYTGILLDIKMPVMDGIEFLEKLRQVKPDVPVLIMTGYPSIPNAAAAIRLGAADYITKPFTPEEITQAVQRMLSVRQVSPPGPTEQAPAPALQPEGFLFFDQSWFQLEADGSACVGVVLPGLQRQPITDLHLPKIGEVVYQGLPLAGLRVADKPWTIIRTPLSGVVAAVNEQLRQRPALLADDPCGQGWVACVCTTRFEEEVGRCRRRTVLLVNADPSVGQMQRNNLVGLGCEVRWITSRDELAEAMPRIDSETVVLWDAASLGEEGPMLVSQLKSVAPGVKVVVLATPQTPWETAYRKQGIFYYAVEPFADKEIVEILDAAFRAIEPPAVPPAKFQKTQAEAISSITITNRNGHKVQLLAAPGLLWRHEGLGALIRQKLMEMMLPVVVTPGEASMAASEILKAASKCDRLMVLKVRDADQLPGALARDIKAEVGGESGLPPVRITLLTIQPDTLGGLSGLDQKTLEALADHIVREMATY